MGIGISKVDKAEQMDDSRLSSLPNEIVEKILSYLKTKEVVRTSILSRRWKSVWESVPTLEVSEDDFRFQRFMRSVKIHDIESRFSKFMDAVLVSRKSPSLEKVSIKISSCVDCNIVIMWMRASLMRDVSELEVDFVLRRRDDTPSELTHDMFPCNKLLVLKLRAQMILHIPCKTSSIFPNLKYLELSDISYRDDTTLPNLLSSCPCLEDLLIIRPGWENMNTLNITSSKLKRLLVNSSKEYSNEPEAEVQKRIIIDVPAVESLEVSFNTMKKLVVKTELTSVVDVKLDLYYVSTACLYQVLKKISNAKFLTLKSGTIMSLLSADLGVIPMFHNLTSLNLEYGAYNDRRTVYYTESTLMLEILKSSPKLETLKIENYSCSYGKYECGIASDWEVHDCVTFRLKNLEFHFFKYARHHDEQRLKYFLANAQVLEMLTICSDTVPAKEILFFNIDNLLIASNKRKIPEPEPVTWSESKIVIPFGTLVREKIMKTMIS